MKLITLLGALLLSASAFAENAPTPSHNIRMTVLKEMKFPKEDVGQSLVFKDGLAANGKTVSAPASQVSTAFITELKPGQSVDGYADLNPTWKNAKSDKFRYGFDLESVKQINGVVSLDVLENRAVDLHTLVNDLNKTYAGTLKFEAID